ncbi:MAG: HAMP domain-containing sensor histidine kinase, partial [Campylobacterota bacterium]|nr:HAMP domain-containing sensor histidine kinase [Campylobacterota bacterium]
VDIELDEIEVNSFKEHSETILTQTQHLSQTIDDFRNFFKPENVKSLVTVQSVIDNLVHILTPSLDSNNIELIITNSAEHKINIFPNELLHVFINIVNNAKEAMLEHNVKNKEISMSVYENIDMMIFDIKNIGKNIDDEIINKIFQPYFSTKLNKNGTGLGLYMSKMIVDKQLNGELIVNNVDDGVVFKIIIPMKQEKK